MVGLESVVEAIKKHAKYGLEWIPMRRLLI